MESANVIAKIHNGWGSYSRNWMEI
jgi:hypothetical protein